jgi:hypothetical protein
VNVQKTVMDQTLAQMKALGVAINAESAASLGASIARSVSLPSQSCGGVKPDPQGSSSFFWIRNIARGNGSGAVEFGSLNLLEFLQI